MLLNPKKYHTNEEKFLYGFFIATIFGTFLSGTMRLFFMHDYFIALFCAVVIAVLLWVVHLYEKQKQYTLTVLRLFWISTAGIFFYIVYFHYTVHIFVAILIPMTASILLERKYFIPHTTLFVILFILLLSYGFLHKEQYPYLNDINFVIGFIILSFYLTLFSYVYHISIKQSYLKLQKTNREKETLLEKINQLNQQLQHKIDIAVQEMQEKDKLLQQQLRMAQMGEMLSMIAHQWRQPLAAISSAMMLIERHIETDKFHMHTKEGLQTFLDALAKKHEEIENNITYLSNTTEDFRNLFNPHTQKTRQCINEPVKKALPLIKSAIHNHTIDLSVELKAKTICELYPNEVMQVVLNLLKNASDALVRIEGERKIILKTYDTRSTSVIEITDNGKGIPSKDLPYIFDPYFSTKGKKIGTGLGLYMVKNIIEEHHGGHIEVESKEGKTTFRLLFTHP